MRKLVLVVALLGGCTRALPIDGGDGGSGGGDGGGSGCAAHQDAASCSADSACIAAGCPQCDGTRSFVGCFDKNNPPPINCPALACASCHGLDEPNCRAAALRGCQTGTCCGTFTGCLDPSDPPPVCAADCAQVCRDLGESTCALNPNCVADRCPACSPGSTYFAGCRSATDPPAMCVPPPCPPPLGCDTITSAGACDARSDCHSVFQPGACGCAGCCCMAFNHCATGAADCKNDAVCNSAPPSCGDPACNGMFTVGVANGCWEGCVRVASCAP